MSLGIVGQRCVSEREPELGLGVVVHIDHSQIGIRFPATGENRLYARGTSTLKRVQFQVGETVHARQGGAPLLITSIEDEGGLLVYVGQDRRLREDALSDVTSVGLPQERLMTGQADACEVFDLRQRALQTRARLVQNELRGFVGGRVDLIPHQFHILQEVASRRIPRVLLSDEVGLGKTIEACLILQRLLAVGKARRALILVPEPLIHQWFVELLRRFNLWFGLFDEERCASSEKNSPDSNPFLAEQLVLCSVAFLTENATRRAQALAAGWDIVIVDEAHHLEWSPEAASPAYEMVEGLARISPGLLLLTATPTQLGLEGHFARLRLLDPNRYNSLEQFVGEMDSYVRVAAIADKILSEKKLTARDNTTLLQIFDKDPERMRQHLDALSSGAAGAREALLKSLLDQHGTGRVVFRNTRAAMSGFPVRKFCAAPLPGDNPTLLARIARERDAEESGREAEIRYSYKDDPRIDWLVGFLQENRPAKVLLCCRSPRKAIAIVAALQEKTGIKIALFHEGIPLVQRDRNAAWFAEPDGAQLLVCSEIGSEGRNFQFAHHLVLFDLPLNPSLLEQRIGRLDRIGQKETIRIHVPYLTGSGEECIVEWYHRGLNAFETAQHSGHDYQREFRGRLLELATSLGSSAESTTDAAAPAAKPRRKNAAKKALTNPLEQLIADTLVFKEELTKRLLRGRDRLLELNSFRPENAARVIERIRELDSSVDLRRFLCDLLDHFGVGVRDHEGGDLFLDPSMAYVEGFPSIPREGMLATFDRKRALAREDIRFLSADHPLVADAIDLLLNAPAGTSAFGLIESSAPRLLLEAVYVLEPVADPRWCIGQYLAPTPIRTIVDLTGKDVSAERDSFFLSTAAKDGNLRRFLETKGFKSAHLKTMLEKAEAKATEASVALKTAAEARAVEALTAEHQRLVDLQRINPHVDPREIELADENLQQAKTALGQARLRIDSVRLILEGPGVSAFAQA